MARHSQESDKNRKGAQSGSLAQSVLSGEQPNLGSKARAAYLVKLGMELAIRGDFNTASVRYREAIAIDPNSEIAHHELGNALQNQGDLVEAAKSYSRQLSINPRACETINLLGIVLQKLGRLDQAVVCYSKALALNGSYAEAHNNLGHALERLGRSNEAFASYQQAIHYKPTLAEAHSNLGSALTDRGDFLKAIESCEKAIALQPGFIECHLRLGNAFKSMGKLSDAARCYQNCISLSPNYSFALNNLADVFKEQGKLNEAVESFQKALGCTPPDPTAYSNMLHFYAFTRHVSPAVERLLAEGWEKSMLTDEERKAARHRASHAGGMFPLRPRAGRKLRLGILSAEAGKTHAVSFFLDPFLKELDRSRFNLTLFPTQLSASSNPQRLQKLLDIHPDNVISLLGVPDAQAAERIRSEQIDILIETSGHTADCRLGVVAHRAAPVQCSYIGYWGTTGLTEMDWFITGAGCDASFDAHFTEGLWRLPRLAYCYAGEASLPESAWEPDPDGTIWLGSFNNNAKIREETLCLWAKVIDALPEAKLLFADRYVQDEETHQRIISTLSLFGIDEERIEFIPFIRGHERHMRLYDRLDIALDTIPFNSGTTAYDALWMGVPLITIEGNSLGETLAGSVVTALDHPEWLAKDSAEYVSTVCSLARDVEGRKDLRKKQRARMAASQLCDAKGLARSLEDALEAMYDRWMTGVGPHDPIGTAS